MSAAAPAPPSPAPVELQRTPLYAFHRAHGAQMVPFAGWEMPLHYGSIVEEHLAVRSGVGLFDVSHMGILTVRGATAAALLSRRTTARVDRLAPGRCRYTFLLNAAGAIVDDLIVDRIDAGAEPAPPVFLTVPNAGRTAKVYDLLREHRKPDTDVTRHNGAVAILAVQGPRSGALLMERFGWSLGGLRPFHGRFFGLAAAPARPAGDPAGGLGGDFPGALGPRAFVSRTGYTGELGYELFVRGADAPALAERLVAGGARPCGLGARDTLRLEKGFLLSGQDFHEDRTPLEAGQERFVEFDHPFVGRPALEKERDEGPAVRCVGLRLHDPAAIPRHGTPVRYGDRVVGTVTSGGFSPSLRAGIALAYVPTPLAAPGTAFALEIRDRRAEAEAVALPFVPSPAPNG